MEISGKVIAKLPLVTGQGKNGEWKKQEFVIQTEGQYTKNVCFSIWGDKINQNTFEVGDLVNVSFEPESREYNGRWFTELRSWKVLKSEKKDAENSEAPTGANFSQENSNDSLSEISDDLPF